MKAQLFSLLLLPCAQAFFVRQSPASQRWSVASGVARTCSGKAVTTMAAGGVDSKVEQLLIKPIDRFEGVIDLPGTD